MKSILTNCEMKYANKVVIIVCLFFGVLSCSAQQNEERQLKKFYRALMSAHKSPDVSPVNDEPFYKLDEMETSRGVLSGRYCYDTYSSNQLHEMENIFRLYYADNGNTVYALLNDSTQKRLLDFTYVRCGSPHFKIDTTINEVYRSYLQWWDTVKLHGLEYARDAGISPTEYCSYSWHGILGHVPTKTISHKKHGQKHLIDSSPLISYSELKQYIFELLDDDEQVHWFVKQNGLRERYLDQSDRQIVTELGILALLNTEEIMTNLFFFKLSHLPNEGFNTELFLKELNDTQSYYDLKILLEKNHIVVVFRN